ncbi:MAG: hypothetical protein IJW28_00865 [Clostridia bacterium]|nr:hypothetical protein [Clostridia bacterium]
MAKKVENKKKKKVNEVEEKEQSQVINTIDNLSEMIISILSNVKDENYKLLTTDKNLSYRQKMKLRSNMYVALSIIKALNNLYECEEKAILDSALYKKAMCVFKETNHKKLSSLLKSGRDATIESYKALCEDIVKELDKLDESYTTLVVELSTNEDGTSQYVLKQVPLVKLDEVLLNTIKKLIKVREHIKREQSKNNQGQVSTDFFRGDNIISRMSETLDYFKEDSLTEPFTNNMVRYILETLSIRFNIMKNPDTTKPEKLEQLKEFNKIISKMEATNLINSASILFETHFDYTQLSHIYNELEDALSTHQHAKKLALLKELDTLLSKLHKDIKKLTTAFKKSLSKSAYKKLEEKLKTYSFIDNNSKIDNELEDEDVDEELDESIDEEDTDETTYEEDNFDGDIDDDDDGIYADEEDDDYALYGDEDDFVEDEEESPKITNPTEEKYKIVNSKKIKKSESNIMYDYDIPDLYDNDEIDISDKALKDKDMAKKLSSISSQTTKEESVKPTTNSINEMVKPKTKKAPNTSKEKDDAKPTFKDYNNIGARLSKLSGLLNKK